MKSSGVKLVLVGLLVAMIIIVSPKMMPLVDRALTPPAVQKTAPVLPPPGVKYLEKVEDLVFDLTNQARRAQGLAPLSKDVELRNVARAYSNDMLVRRFFDHTDPDGVAFDERISEQYRHWVHFVGENIWFASGYNTSNAQRLAKEIVADWMSSPGHRAVMLDPDFTHLGVGVSARNDRIRATQEFVGRPRFFIFGANS